MNYFWLCRLWDRTSLRIRNVVRISHLLFIFPSFTFYKPVGKGRVFKKPI